METEQLLIGKLKALVRLSNSQKKKKKGKNKLFKSFLKIKYSQIQEVSNSYFLNSSILKIILQDILQVVDYIIEIIEKIQHVHALNFYCDAISKHILFESHSKR